MPPRSEAQRRAMEAAAHGHSTLGIPKKVGKEFSNADPGGKLPEKKKSVDRSAHWKGNPGFPSSHESGSPPPKTYQSHESREQEVMGAGYKQHEAAERASYGNGSPHKFNAPSTSNAHTIGTHRREGHLRMSGHKSAHRIGKR